MAHFVLVHGSGQNAASWKRVADPLTARGHTVATPELPKSAPDACIDDLARQIAAAADGERAVFVAHSLSGLFLPRVAAHAECARLIYLAAVVPEPGLSVREQFAADPSMFCPGWIEAGARWFDPAQRDALGREFLFHDCDADALQFGLATMDPIDSRGLVVEPNPCASWPAVPTAALVATHDRTLSAAWCRQRARTRLGVIPIEIATGHCPQVSAPVATAALLARLAVADPH